MKEPVPSLADGVYFEDFRRLANSGAPRDRCLR
jgi:hypothetical protein